MNFFEFNKKFPTELACIHYFINIRYTDKVRCNHCKSDKVSHRKNTPKVFDCSKCHNTFSIFKGTIFEKSDTDLRKWIYAIHLLLNSKKGISGYQLQREISVSYKTAWRILYKIREAMGNKKNNDNDNFMNTIIEIDETYLGGKAENAHMKKRIKTKEKLKKDIVLGILERTKEVRAFRLDNTRANTIYGKIVENVAKDSKIITDEHKSYHHLHSMYDHTSINHSKGEFKKSNDLHTNTIEGFWSILKRGVYGVYHSISSKYVQNYVNEFCFRYNNRENDSIFNLVLKQAIL